MNKLLRFIFLASSAFGTEVVVNLNRSPIQMSQAPGSIFRWIHIKTWSQFVLSLLIRNMITRQVQCRFPLPTAESSHPCRVDWRIREWQIYQTS